jgi:hypothetical protein
MSKGLRVEPQRSRADRRAFVNLPYRLYADEPNWVAPLRMAEAALMNRKKNPFFQHAEVEHFVARRGRRVVGRIAAIENRLHNEIHEDRVGFFGFFDVEPDPEAAAALVAAADEWIRARGLGPLRGPVNYSTNDACGVLVDGFDEPPAVLMPYNRPDYDALLTGAGLVGVKDLLAYWVSTSVDLPDRFRRVVERRLGQSGVRMRDIDLADFDREVETLKDLYNRSWEKNWSFVPATDAEFRHAAKDLKQVLLPKVSAVAEKNGRPVAFSAFIQDVNVVLRGSNGRLLPFLWLKLLWGLRRVRRARCILLGIVPEARGGVIAAAFFLRAHAAGRAEGYEGAEAGWVLEDNAAMREPLEVAGAPVTKRYRMYETAPDPAGPASP